VLLARLADERVEGAPVLALAALLQPRGDVERHLRIPVPDLAHHPGDADAIGAAARSARDRVQKAPASGPQHVG
jgi:hypothetical protein